MYFDDLTREVRQLSNVNTETLITNTCVESISSQEGVKTNEHAVVEQTRFDFVEQRDLFAGN